jgi:hypothetical protein
VRPSMHLLGEIGLHDGRAVVPGSSMPFGFFLGFPSVHGVGRVREDFRFEVAF